MNPSGADVESGLDDFKQEVVDGDSASAVHSFQGRFAPTLDKTLSQNALALEKDSPTVVRYSIGSQAPRLTEALLLGERIHLALVEMSDGASVFTGCDELGNPLKGHAHAFIFSESNLALGRGRNGEITHVTIYAPAGFGSAEVSTLEDLKEIQGSGLYVQLNLLGLGRPEDYGGLDPSRARALCWQSRGLGSPARLSSLRATPRPRGQAHPNGMPMACRSAVPSMSCEGC